MSTFLPLIPDLLIAAVLGLFAWRGARRGMILTLCSLLALIVAFVGATYFARFLAPPVSAQIQPFFAGAIEQTITEQIGGRRTEEPDPAATPNALPTGAETSAPPSGPSPDLDLDVDLGALGLFLGSDWYERIVEAVRGSVADGISAVSKSLAATLADMAAYVALFLFGFVVILLLWFVISHALDLAFRLPVLSTLNMTGGLILGVLKALALLFMLASVVRRYPDLIPENLVAQSYLLRFFLTVSPWAFLLGGQEEIPAALR